MCDVVGGAWLGRGAEAVDGGGLEGEDGGGGLLAGFDAGLVIGIDADEMRRTARPARSNKAISAPSRALGVDPFDRESSCDSRPCSSSALARALSQEAEEEVTRGDARLDFEAAGSTIWRARTSTKVTKKLSTPVAELLHERVLIGRALVAVDREALVDGFGLRGPSPCRATPSRAAACSVREEVEPIGDRESRPCPSCRCPSPSVVPHQGQHRGGVLAADLLTTCESIHLPRRRSSMASMSNPCSAAGRSPTA